MRRTFLLILAGCLPVLAGCVEGEQTFTLNPDGSGKVRVDVVMVPPMDPLGGGQDAKKPADKTVDDFRQDSLKILLDAKGIDAWSDVTAEFAPDGRLKFAGTGYFKKLEEYEIKNVMFLGSGGHALTGKPGGPLTLAKSKDKDKKDADGPDLKPGLGGDKTPEQIAKMTDTELDEYILKQRIQYQQMKPMLRMMIGDAKVKTTYKLPGEPEKVIGLKREGPQSVSFVIDGNRLLAAIDKLFALDNKEMRKLYRAGPGAEMKLLGEFADINAEVNITIPKPGKAQFDYDKEVKAAKDAYPMLRKKLKLRENIHLPGEPGGKNFGKP